MKQNVVLVGMPGAGKSTIGVVLAKILGYHFLDSDLLIQEKEGRLLHEIIAEDGLNAFIGIEERVNSEIVTDKTVIATGGSVVYGLNAMKHLSEIGTVVYLQADYQTIEQRLGDLKQRGVAMTKDQTLQHLYEERCPLYERYADMIICVNDSNIREVATQIVKNVRECN